MGQWGISERLIQHFSWCPVNLKGNCHNVQSPCCPAYEGQGRPQIPCSSNPLGGTNLDFQKEWCIYKRKSDGLCIINLKTTCQKLLLAACAIVAIENPADVIVILSRNTGQWTGLKIAAVTWSSLTAGDLTPGTFPNYIQAAFCMLGLLVVTDPRGEDQHLGEVPYVYLSAITLSNRLSSALCVHCHPLQQ